MTVVGCLEYAAIAITALTVLRHLAVAGRRWDFSLMSMAFVILSIEAASLATMYKVWGLNVVWTGQAGLVICIAVAVIWVIHTALVQVGFASVFMEHERACFPKH